MFLEIFSTDIYESASAMNLSTLDKFLEQLADQAVSLTIRIGAAIVVFFVGRWIITLLRKFIDKFLNRRQIETTVKRFLDSLANITFKLVLFLLIINILGIQATSFAAIIAAVGLAVGMSMKDNLSNFAGGVMLLINKPFRVGERIVAQGVDGTVQAIGILYTILLTGDNVTIYIPNGPLSTGNIINYSAQKERRIDITFNINYGIDLEELRKMLHDILNANKSIKEFPQPFIGITKINNGTVDITIRIWVKSSDYSTVSVALNEEIYAAFIRKGFYAPSTLNIRMLND